MMSLETIHHLSREAAARAARDGREPFWIQGMDLVTWAQDLDQGMTPRLPFPDLGDYRPEGWRMVDTIFCDHSGWGAPGEAALTPEELIRTRLRPQHGYAIIETGQFQLYLGEFVRDEDAEAEMPGDPEALVFCEYCEDEHLMDDDGTCSWCGEDPFGQWVDGEYVVEQD